MNGKFMGFIPVIAALALTSCTPTRVDPAVPLPSVKDWQHGQDAEAISSQAVLASWWRGFRDPVLDKLIAEAMTANQDLRIAKARVQEAQQIVTVTESALYPSVDFNVEGGRQKTINRVFGITGPNGTNLVAPAGNAFTGGLAARWEIDLFGGRHLDAEAANAQAAGIHENEHAVRVGLLAQVATNYLELRGVQTRTRILEDIIASEQERLRVIRALHKAGLARDGDVARQETLLHVTQAGLSALTAEADTLIHRLGVLSGKPPASLRDRLLSAASLPEAAPKLPRLMPAALLEQRPDLRVAKTQVEAMAASLGAARTDLYPKLVLSVSGGFGALAIGGFPALAEGVYGLGAGLTAPIFNAGRIQAQITAADARLEQAAANYEKTFLTAMEDVENAYVQYRSITTRRDELLRAEIEAEKSRREADALFRRGVANLLQVLDAQHAKLQIGDERARAETGLAVAMVSLYRAFGGGWQEEAVLVSRASTD
ncbi:efflux transporter outer membrane subunit [Candidatus Methylospira mobilis]|uniref:Efflux transporter outer membrane subunit n=1 Tax=Candidatus Methylospira mobilis TaxID=1808979 RepID=A0A5Q0BMA2_9GAMM|nr:efflux transporter outer membrane subunit [Candidatus Methylospira mobilis]QFY44272.1 efflux transporter outer membrane subunit [Candidatus Methylospira mobilis]